MNLCGVELITDRLPERADATAPYQTVMVFLGRWGWANSFWRDVKAGQPWASGYVDPPPAPTPPQRRGAWM